MATKLKIFIKSSLTQTVVRIILTVLVLVVTLSLMFIGRYEDTYYSGLYESDGFRYEFQRRVHNVIEKELVLKSTENIEKMAVEDKFYDYNEMISRWYQIQTNLADAPSFRYYIQNNDTSEQYSNFSYLRNKDNLSKYAFRLTIDANKIEATEIRNGRIIYLESYSGSTILSNAKALGNWEGAFVLQEPFESNDVFKELTDQYHAIVPFIENQSNFYAGIVGVVILGIFLFVYLVVNTITVKKFKKSISDAIPNDLKSIMIVGSFPFMLDIIEEFTFDPFIMIAHQKDQWLEIAIIALVFLWVFIGLQFTLSLISALVEGSFFKNTVVYMIFKRGCQFVTKIFKNLSRSKMFRRRVLIFVFSYGFVTYVLGMFFALDYELLSLSLWVIFNVLCFYWGYRNLWSLQQIMSYVSEGNISELLDSENISPLFYSFANQINGLQQNLQKAIQEAIKGERLKTELITNVSHDLKTPLTAIVNYTSLLKNKAIEDEETVKYIQVIDEKAGVLKRLIDDVLEVSKVSSGNVEIHMEVLDINQLIQQVLGEFEEALNNQNLSLITTELTTPLYVEADSLKLWRVVQNLVSNITKYALPASRVFILAKSTDKHVVVEFKNISKDMLLTGNNELMERFVRGDVSRTQEGFGLGLAIGSELMTLQKGHLDIVVDGDLFKVILTLNVCENQ